jgi:aspartate/methionine/tyrosine aminotransferase
MSYAVNSDVSAVNPPPIADVHRWLDGVDTAALGGVLDVAQAVPVEPPAASLLEHTGAVMRQQGLHRYTPIRGLPDLCESLAAHMAHGYGGEVDERDVVITAGCNQAFCATMRAMTRPGDEVVLPVPYYFNHQMWLDMLGVTAVHLPFNADAGGVPALEDYARCIGPNTRALIAVTPNNPTGAVYPDELLEGLFDLAAAHNIALVLDETYKDFHPTPERPHHLFQRPSWRDTLVQLFSFSKSYSLAGYRVGSVIAGERLVAEVTKVQDCISICASHVSQVAALYAVNNLSTDVARRARAMEATVETIRQAVRDTEDEHGFVLLSAGAWFAYLAHPFTGYDAYEVSQTLAQRLGVLSVPGTLFGPDQGTYIRFAFANLCAGDAQPLVTRLAGAAALFPGR